MSSSTGKQDSGFYKNQSKIYPREVKGRFASLRLLAMVVLLGIYYVMPWIPWGDRQAVLFDLPARKFYIFGLTFWPQDLFFLALLLIIAALALFFFTTLAGRLWCGFACPQTVWTEIFLWMENRIEGDRRAQMKLDRQPWDVRKLRIKVTKHTVWLAFSAWTGFTFVGYFTPVDVLWREMVTMTLGPWEGFWVFFYSLATWGNAGWLREQVCIYMCPYARFQSVMFDANTMIVSYDTKRGEPRGSRKRGVDLAEQGLGECINCNQCVQACPTGIDIRDGLQYQCIGCAACVDICDQVMDKMDYPRGLIRFTTENALEGKGMHILRPRIWLYSGALLLLCAALVVGIYNRVPLELDIFRDRNSLYRETPEGLVENIYSMRAINMDDSAHDYMLTVEGLDNVQIVGQQRFHAQPQIVEEFVIKLRMDPYDLKKVSTHFNFVLQAEDDDGIRQVEKARFLGPGGG